MSAPVDLSKVITSCALTAQQSRLWEETRIKLGWDCPAFIHVLYEMLTRREQHAIFTETIPTAATDGKNLLINPKMFFTFGLFEREFIVAHEILHCIFCHIILMYGFKQKGYVLYPDGKKIPYVHEIMNWAADLVINDILIKSKIGKMPMKDGKPFGCHDPSIATAQDAVLDAYRKLFEKLEKEGRITYVNQPGTSQGNQQGQGGGQGQKQDKGKSGKKATLKGEPGQSFDEHLAPGAAEGKDPFDASQEHNETEWQTGIQQAMQAAKAQGKLPAGMQLAFDQWLTPKVSWQEYIQSWFARKVGAGSFDWKRPDRRLIVRDIYAPGRSGFVAGTVVMGIDTSGSIVAEPATLDMFFAEMAGLLEEVRPKRLIVMWCDAHVHRVDELSEPDDLNWVRAKGTGGGGGTDFRPVFDKIAEMDLDPDALVYLTDGYGSFPKAAPTYNTIWGTIALEPEKYPFGEAVRIPKQVSQ